ncbi:hypothetical protein HK096_009085, partial [Nowakowskiella sp. JEL0078]
MKWLNQNFNKKAAHVLQFIVPVVLISFNAILHSYCKSFSRWILFQRNFVNDLGVQTHKINPEILVVLITIGTIISSFFVGYSIDWVCGNTFKTVGLFNNNSFQFGRLKGIQYGAILIVIGTFMQLFCWDFLLLYIGAFVIGCGLSFTTTTAPVYLVEISITRYRGLTVAFYSSTWLIGDLLYFNVDLFFSSHSQVSWRYACAVQSFIATVILLSCFGLPESPRWLVSCGQTENAVDFFRKYHFLKDDEARKETYNIEQSFLSERKANSGSYFSLFATSNRRRMIVVLFISFFVNVSGMWIVTFFLAHYRYFLAVDGRSLLYIRIVSFVVSFLSSIVGSIFVLQAGRRSYLIFGTLSICLCFHALFFAYIAYDRSDILAPMVFGGMVLIIIQIFNSS